MVLNPKDGGTRWTVAGALFAMAAGIVGSVLVLGFVTKM